jgi:adenosylcobyric acid synthase
LIAYPYASNFDEFDPLLHEVGVHVTPVRSREPLDTYDAVILPGSKNTAASMKYLLHTGLAAEITAAARRGAMIYGVCGGMQMLGAELRDPHSIEDGDVSGLGLLDLTTELQPHKITQQRNVRWPGGGELTGYEIHHGRTEPGSRVQPHLSDGLGWRQQNVIGVYLHDIFKNTAYRQWWLHILGWRGAAHDWHKQIDAELNRIAELVVTTGWAKALVNPMRDS